MGYHLYLYPADADQEEIWTDDDYEFIYESGPKWSARNAGFWNCEDVCAFVSLFGDPDSLWRRDDEDTLFRTVSFSDFKNLTTAARQTFCADGYSCAGCLVFDALYAHFSGSPDTVVKMEIV